MQLNLHGSLCIPAVFLYCYGDRKKRNLAQSPRKYAILTFRFKKNSFGAGGTAPSPAPFHLLLAPLAPRLGSRLRRSSLPPNFYFWIRLWCRVLWNSTNADHTTIYSRIKHNRRTKQQENSINDRKIDKKNHREKPNLKWAVVIIDSVCNDITFCCAI